jgi:hypothetical protein
MPRENQLPAPLERPRPVAVERLLARASRYAEAALAPATRRAYERDFRTFADCVPPTASGRCRQARPRSLPSWPPRPSASFGP